MTLAPADFTPPSPLSTVLGQVRDVFASLGDATPIMVGRHYLEQAGFGSGPRILFVPIGGAFEEPSEMGAAGAFIYRCKCYVRATETGDDITRLDNAERLAEIVVGCLAVACSGRLKRGDFEDTSPVDAQDSFGADFSFTFGYARDLHHTVSRWELPAATPSPGSEVLRPAVPPGGPAEVEAANVVVEPEEA